MDELEWLRGNSPSTEPSRDITKRHRTQLRAAIAGEGAEGPPPRRPRRGRRSRHRVLVTSAVVVALCAAGAGVVALATAGGDGGGGVEVGAPATDPATTAAAAPVTCTGAPPAEVAIPTDFGAGVATPAAQATTAPTKGQQVTSWSTSDAATTIEQRWPADQEAIARFGSPAAPVDSFRSYSDKDVLGDGKRGYRRTVLFEFPAGASGCTALQMTVYGRDAGTVDRVAEGFVTAPFVSHQPLVSTTGAAASAPPVVACTGATRVKAEAAAMPAVATVGGPVDQASFAQPTEALTDFLAARTTLAARGYDELRLDDGSFVYTKSEVGNVVTAVHVVPNGTGWTVADWQASGC